MHRTPMFVWLVAGAVAICVVIAAQLLRLRAAGALRPGGTGGPGDEAGLPRPVVRPAGGIWLIAALTYMPLMLACAVAWVRLAPPLIHNRTEALELLGLGAIGLLAYAGHGLLERTSYRGPAGITVAAVQAVLGTVAVLSVAMCGVVYGRIEARAPAPILLVMLAAGLAAYLLVFAATPDRMPGIDAGLGPQSIPYLGAFSVVLVPVLSDDQDLIATKVAGWLGIGVLVVAVGVLGYAVGDVRNLGRYLSSGDLPKHVKNLRALITRSAILLTAAAGVCLALRS